jgi:hypothetical protein
VVHKETIQIMDMPSIQMVGFLSEPFKSRGPKVFERNGKNFNLITKYLQIQSRAQVPMIQMVKCYLNAKHQFAQVLNVHVN